MLREEWEAGDLAKEPWEIVGDVPRRFLAREASALSARRATVPLAAAALAGGEARAPCGADRARRAADPALELHALLERQADALDRRAAVGKHRLLREAGEPLGQLERAVEVLAGRDDLVHEADAMCLLARRPRRPERISSSARPMPTMRGSRCVPPSIRGTPQRRSKRPKVEPSVAIRRSHHSASSTPPARHQPEIAAIAGLDGVRRVKPIGPSGWSGSSVAIDFRSAPAQKATSPAPVRTITRASSSASKRRNPSRSSSAVGPSTALRRSGPVDRQDRGAAGALVADGLLAHARDGIGQSGI